MAHNVTKSTEEAMTLLERYRKWRIQYARHEAFLLARIHGKVHGRMVWEKMWELGLLHDGNPDYWLGSVFRKKSLFLPLEGYIIPEGEPPVDRNIHEWRPVREWVLRPGAVEPPAIPPWVGEIPEDDEGGDIGDRKVEVLKFSGASPCWVEISLESLKKGCVFRVANDLGVMGTDVRFCTSSPRFDEDEDGDESFSIKVAEVVEL